MAWVAEFCSMEHVWNVWQILTSSQWHSVNSKHSNKDVNISIPV